MNIKIRPWNESDLPSLVKYANNPIVAQYLTNQFPHPYTEEDGKAFIEFSRKDDPIHIFAIEIDGEAIGGIGIHPKEDIHFKNAELGYWIGEPFWGKGIATFALKHIVDFAFENYDINRLYASAFGPNKGSQRVLEKSNFQLEATFTKTVFKNNEFYDELFYAIRRSEWKSLKKNQQ
nr:GNAT family protein [uncultured Carboxylicivirga sp.]